MEQRDLSCELSRACPSKRIGSKRTTSRVLPCCSGSIRHEETCSSFTVTYKPEHLISVVDNAIFFNGRDDIRAAASPDETKEGCGPSSVRSYGEKGLQGHDLDQ